MIRTFSRTCIHAIDQKIEKKFRTGRLFALLIRENAIKKPQKNSLIKTLQPQHSKHKLKSMECDIKRKLHFEHENSHVGILNKPFATNTDIELMCLIVVYNLTNNKRYNEISA